MVKGISSPEPEARLSRQQKETRAVFMAHSLRENRNEMLKDFQVTLAKGPSEREVVRVLLKKAQARRFHARALGGYKN